MVIPRAKEDIETSCYGLPELSSNNEPHRDDHALDPEKSTNCRRHRENRRQQPDAPKLVAARWSRPAAEPLAADFLSGQ
jgi:hypothetical protein